MKQTALRPESYTKKVALVLQGGGALGSYQAGVYEALASSDYKPDWVAGISIGAINAALIAGNSPEMRVEKLREFWRTITTSAIWPVPNSDLVNGAGLPFDLGKQISPMHALMVGQSNFLAPRKAVDWLCASRAERGRVLKHHGRCTICATASRCCGRDCPTI